MRRNVKVQRASRSTTLPSPWSSRVLAVMSAGFVLPAISLCAVRLVLDALLAEVLTRRLLARLVTVVLRGELGLLLGVGIRVAVVLALVGRQRRRRITRVVIVAIPAVVARVPLGAPMLAPARRVVASPAMEIRGRGAVVAHRHLPQVERHEFRPHHAPRAVVPVAREPLVALEHPVEAIVEEVIGV